MNISRRPHWQPLGRNPNKDYIKRVYQRTSVVQAPANHGFKPGEGASLTDLSKLRSSDEDKVEFHNGLVLADHPDGGVSVKLTDGTTYRSPGELEVDDCHVRVRFEIQDQLGKTEQWTQELDNNGSATLRTRGGGGSGKYVSFSKDGKPDYTHGPLLARRRGNAITLEGEKSSETIVPPVPPEQFFA